MGLGKNYYFVDRLKDTIRRRGENISSWELEQEILSHPAVRECAVVACASRFGEDEVRTFVVPGGQGGRGCRVGPFEGVRVVEVGGLGPVPFAGMVLSDLGARVLRIVRPAGPGTPKAPEETVVGRGRATVALDLRAPAATEAVLAAVDRADVLMEGFRPGGHGTARAGA